MEIKRLAGILILILFVLILVEILTSGILGGINSDFIMFSIIILVVISLIFVLLNLKGIKKVVTPVKSFSENTYNVFKNLSDEDVDADEEFVLNVEKKSFIKRPAVDIALPVKDKFFIRHRAKSSTNIYLHDPVSGKNIGFIGGTLISGVPEDVAAKISKINDIISENKKEVIVAQVPAKEEGKK